MRRPSVIFLVARIFRALLPPNRKRRGEGHRLQKSSGGQTSFSYAFQRPRILPILTFIINPGSEVNIAPNGDFKLSPIYHGNGRGRREGGAAGICKTITY